MESDFCILIMAGGKGTRFWPKSTEEKPKQFLNLTKLILVMNIQKLMKL